MISSRHISMRYAILSPGPASSDLWKSLGLECVPEMSRMTDSTFGPWYHRSNMIGSLPTFHGTGRIQGPTVFYSSTNFEGDDMMFELFPEEALQQSLLVSIRWS